MNGLGVFAAANEVYLFRAKRPSLRWRFESGCERLVLHESQCGRGWGGTIDDLIAGVWDQVPGGVFDLRLGITGSDWIQLLPSQRPPNVSATLSRTKGIFALILKRDPKAPVVEVSGYNDGEAESVFRAVGDLTDRLDEYTLDWPGLPRSLVQRCRTVDEAVGVLLKRLNAKPLPLTVQCGKNGWKLTSADQKPLLATMFTGLNVARYWPVTEETNPASVQLQESIEAGSPTGVRRAIAAGADLKWMPRGCLDPLSYAFMQRKKPKWLEVIKTLMELGCRMPQLSYMPVMMVKATLNVSCPRPASTSMDLIDYLLSLGEDINSQNRKDPSAAGTALHAAAKDHKAAVVMYLVARGADVHALLYGKRASSLLRLSPSPFGKLGAAIQSFLLRIESGGRRPTVEEVRAIAPIGDRCQKSSLAAIKQMISVLDAHGQQVAGEQRVKRKR